MKDKGKYMIRFVAQVSPEREDLNKTPRLPNKAKGELGTTYYCQEDEVIWCLVRCSTVPLVGWQVDGLPEDYEWVKDVPPTVNNIVYSCKEESMTISLVWWRTQWG